ncbi:hypothetical protein JRQ81_008257 [Phrynocephalus forsythii]|uniref:SH3 domain-containing protein n=1 Tax=Phrynocephalus forsythii TaxID=171643 RepID=A0A9Q0XC20_9SAUR|nr:hypothetical protein JRQ81_008257 [Phrynocephalus forsythii]
MGDGLPELPGSATWRAPTRRGRRLRRKRREPAGAVGPDAGVWRSSSPEMMDEEDSARLFVALFDFDPVSMSPNPDAAEEELPFQEGQVLKVYGQKDLDGFYRGMCGDRVGYIPCNMVSEVQVDNDRVRQRLLQEGCLAADPLEDHLAGNGAFSTLAQRSALCPPKPRRSKKAGQKRQQEEVPNFGLGDIRDPSSEEETPRTMVAIFDYNPAESSPNADIEAELNFCAGDLVTILGSMDNDGFYYAEINGKKGLVPSNFVEALVSDEGLPGEPSLGKQQDLVDHEDTSIPGGFKNSSLVARMLVGALALATALILPKNVLQQEKRTAMTRSRDCAAFGFQGTAG